MAAVYRGSRSYIGEQQQASGINKVKTDRELKVTCDGIEGDFVGDKILHGGREKALHHFPADHYQKLSDTFPRSAEMMIPGSIGENTVKIIQSNKKDFNVIFLSSNNNVKKAIFHFQS